MGYDNIDKKLVVNEEEARIVRLIFKLYSEGSMSCSAIAGYLNGMGLKTKRGFEFRGSSISYIIHNTVYIGINRHLIGRENQYSVKGDHAAIIDDELWNKAQKVSTGARRRTSRKAADISGIQIKAFCMKCGRPLKNFHASSKGKKYMYLRCCNCSNYVNAEKLEKAVLEAIEPDMGNLEHSELKQLPELLIKRIEAYKDDVNIVLNL